MLFRGKGAAQGLNILGAMAVHQIGKPRRFIELHCSSYPLNLLNHPCDPPECTGSNLSQRRFSELLAGTYEHPWSTSLQLLPFENNLGEFFLEGGPFDVFGLESPCKSPPLVRFADHIDPHVPDF